MAYIPPRVKTKQTINYSKAEAQSLVYNTGRWTTLRNIKMQNNPICECCLTKSIITPAQEVHHIVPFMTGADINQKLWLGFDYNNLESLCIECHHSKHKKG